MLGHNQVGIEKQQQLTFFGLIVCSMPDYPPTNVIIFVQLTVTKAKEKPKSAQSLKKYRIGVLKL